MRGGKREGSGRPLKYHEETQRVVIYCPKSKVKELREKVKEILKQYEKLKDYENKTRYLDSRVCE